MQSAACRRSRGAATAAAHQACSTDKAARARCQVRAMSDVDLLVRRVWKCGQGGGGGAAMCGASRAAFGARDSAVGALLLSVVRGAVGVQWRFSVDVVSVAGRHCCWQGAGDATGANPRHLPNRVAAWWGVNWKDVCLGCTDA
eukprot:366462-Chlamydomonas_euryale.AAC.42